MPDDIETSLTWPQGGLADAPELDATFSPHSAFQAGLPGITGDEVATDPATGRPVQESPHLTWMPTLSPRQRSRWQRVTRPRVAIVVLWTAAVAAAGVTSYLLLRKPTHPSGAGSAVQTSPETTGAGSATTLAGAACAAGTTRATISLTSAQAADGTYDLTASGSLSNAASSQLSNVSVTWLVTYADGYTAVQTAPVANGAAVAGNSTTTWHQPAQHNEGTVPPVRAEVIRILGQPTPPACA